MGAVVWINDVNDFKDDKDMARSTDQFVIPDVVAVL